MKNAMTTWMKDRNETRVGEGTGKREHVPSPGFYEMKDVILHNKRVWGNKCWAMRPSNNTKIEQQFKKKRYERTEH